MAPGLALPWRKLRSDWWRGLDLAGWFRPGSRRIYYQLVAPGLLFALHTALHRVHTVRWTQA